MIMEKYLNVATTYIHSQYTHILQNTRSILKKSFWKEGTKPQNKQLLAVHDASKQLEELYADFLESHIKCIRLFNYHDERVRECVNGVQIFRKKGMLALIKAVYPDLGKDVVLPTTSNGTYFSDEFGVYGLSWNWATIGSVYGKLSGDSTPINGVVVLPTKMVDTLGHASLEKKSNQYMFNELYSSLLKGEPVNAFGNRREGKVAVKHSTAKPAVSDGYWTYSSPVFAMSDPVESIKPDPSQSTFK